MAGPGVAVREFPLKTGEADYGLYIDGKVEIEAISILYRPYSAGLRYGQVKGLARLQQNTEGCQQNRQTQTNNLVRSPLLVDNFPCSGNFCWSGK